MRSNVTGEIFRNTQLQQPEAIRMTTYPPIILQDDFDEHHWIAWRIEPATPDPENPLLEGEMPWDDPERPDRRQVQRVDAGDVERLAGEARRVRVSPGVHR